MSAPDLSARAVPGARIAVRVTPKASRARIVEDGEVLRVYVTEPPADGRANAAVQKALARALGVPKTSLTLVSGAGARDKVFRLD